MQLNNLWKENDEEFLIYRDITRTEINTDCRIVFEQQYSYVAVTDTDLEQQTQLPWKQTNYWARGLDVTRNP